jgi:hypothetical protein
VFGKKLDTKVLLAELCKSQEFVGTLRAKNEFLNTELRHNQSEITQLKKQIDDKSQDVDNVISLVSGLGINVASMGQLDFFSMRALSFLSAIVLPKIEETVIPTYDDLLETENPRLLAFAQTLPHFGVASEEDATRRQYDYIFEQMQVMLGRKTPLTPAILQK